jgi:oligopeptidase B
MTDSSSIAQHQPGQSRSVAPVPARKPLLREHHGDTVVDNYEWLRDKDDSEVIAYLTAENAHTDSNTAHLATLRSTLFNEIVARTRETDLSVPVRHGGWWYYSRTVEGKQYGIHCRLPVADSSDWTPPVIAAVATGGGADAPAGEQVLLDDNIGAQDHDFYSLGTFEVSSDGNLLAYAVDTAGDERYLLRVIDLRTGEHLPDTIQDTAPGAIFSPDARFIFYTTVDDAWRPDTVWRHEVGNLLAPDTSVFHEPDERFWVGIGLTKSERFIEIQIGSKVTSEVRLLDSADPTGEFRVVWPRTPGIEYSIDHAIVAGEDRLLILHNQDAINFTLIDAPIDDPENRTRQRVIIPADAEHRLEDVEAFAGFVTVDYRRSGLTRVGIIRLSDSPQPFGELTEIEFDEPLFQVGTGSNPEWTQPSIRLGYTSFLTPSTVYDYSIDTGTLTVLKRQEVLGGFNPAQYEQLREWAVADDGTRIPISIVRPAADAKGDRTGKTDRLPFVLYGYGAYEASIDPSFSISRLSLLERGIGFAIAHVRGGGELGRSWYDDGKLLSKKNSFTDFVAVALHLGDVGIADRTRIVAEGGSAGGLLMGAVTNLAPELFAGVVAQVPFVDPLTSILDPELPLTVTEWDEWGDPLHNAEVYRYMKSYSPYENVRSDVTYPPILALTSLNDTRVLFCEPAKWTARLREVGANALLKTEMAAGHGGVSGRYERWHEIAFENAWIIDRLGLADRSSSRAG